MHVILRSSHRQSRYHPSDPAAIGGAGLPLVVPASQRTHLTFPDKSLPCRMENKMKKTLLALLLLSLTLTGCIVAPGFRNHGENLSDRG